MEELSYSSRQLKAFLSDLFGIKGCNIMRGAHNLRLTDVHKIQKNLKEKSQREAEALLQLMELPDFDTSE